MGYFKEWLGGKRKERILNFDKSHAMNHYDHILTSINYWFYDKLFESEQILSADDMNVLNNIIKMISRDLEMTYRNRFLYETVFNKTTTWRPFPTEYFDEKGNEIKTIVKNKTSINSKYKYIMAVPCNRISFRNHILRKEHFDQRKNPDIHGIFYSESNIIYIYEGKHSISFSLVKDEEIDLVIDEFCDFNKILDNVYTDGWAYYDVHNKKIIDYVFNTKAAVLFTLLKRRRELKM